MFEGKKTVTQAIVDEFDLPKTTIHRQLFGKKYPGGGQTLQKLRSQDRKVEATGSGQKKVAIILKRSWQRRTRRKNRQRRKQRRLRKKIHHQRG